MASPEAKKKAYERQRLWLSNNMDRNREHQKRYGSKPETKARHAQRKRERRAKNEDVQRIDNVKHRLSVLTGLPVSDLPSDLIEAKMLQLKVRSATRKSPRKNPA